jgi:integrase
MKAATAPKAPKTSKPRKARAAAMEVTIQFHEHGKGSYAQKRIPIWEVTWPTFNESGRTKRKNAFRYTKKEAEELAAEKRRALAAGGKDAVSLSKEEEAELRRFRAWRATRPGAPDLCMVLSRAIEDESKVRHRKTVTEAVEDRIRSAEARNLRERSQQSLRTPLRRFAEDFGDRDIATVRKEEVEQWLNRLRSSKNPESKLDRQTWVNYARVVGSVFVLAMENGIIDRSPTEHIKAPRKAPAEIHILSPAEVRALFAAAHPSIIPALVVQAFCGVRRAEAERLRWENIKTEVEGEDSRPYIEMSPAITKTSRRRTPRIPENALAFLRAFRRLPHDLILPEGTRYRYALEAAAKAAGIKWSPNLLRHSFASYMMADHMNANLVCEAMGNSVNVVFQHYREVCSPADAKAFFSILPEDGAAPENVVRFGKTA